MKRLWISVSGRSAYPFARFGGKMCPLLIVSLALILLPGFDAVSRAEERRLSPDGRFEYVLREDGTAAIRNWIENSGVIEVPASVDGHPVTTIGSYAFQDLYDAETLHLPEGITTIQDHAFSGFFTVNRMNLPSTVVSVGVNPWVNCNDLTDFEIEGDDPEYFLSGGCLYGRDHTLIACLEGLCPGENVQVLPGTRVIGDRAFFGGSGRISHVALPEGIEEIGARSLTSLEEIELPSTVITIGDYAFDGGDMEEAVLPGGIRSIGANPFVWCRNLARIQIDGENPRYRVVENALYDLETHTLISWPLGCGETEPVIQEGTRTIGGSAFYYAETGQIRLPEGLRAIGDAAFYHSSLQSVCFPSSLESIGGTAFANCVSLNVPPFPDGLREIGDYAFRFASWTEPLVLPEGLARLGADPFAGCDLPFGIRVAGNNTHFAAENGFLYDTDEYRLIKCWSGAERIRIPDGIRTIGSRAFWQNETMLWAELPDSVETIEHSAFRDCISMESIAFSANLRAIGVFAFAGCDALTEITLPDTLALIDDGGFAFCSVLKEVSLAGEHAVISPSAFFMTDAVLMGPDGEIVFTLKKNLPLI